MFVCDNDTHGHPFITNLLQTDMEDKRALNTLSLSGASVLKIKEKKLLVWFIYTQDEASM